MTHSEKTLTFRPTAALVADVIKYVMCKNEAFGYPPVDSFVMDLAHDHSLIGAEDLRTTYTLNMLRRANLLVRKYRDRLEILKAEFKRAETTHERKVAIIKEALELEDFILQMIEYG